MGAIPAGIAYVNVVPNMAGFVAGMQRGMAGAGAKLMTMGTMLTKRLTLPIAAVGYAAVKLGTDFEKSMQMIVGLVGISQKQVDAWSEDLLKMSKELPQSPKELADALYFVTSAGIKAKDAMAVLEASAKASAAGLGDTAIIADAVTSAVNAYGIEVVSAADATDILTEAVRLGKVEASQLAPNIGKLTPIAEAVGVSFNEAAGAVAALSRTGDSAARATTGIVGVLRTFLKPAVQTRELLLGVGTSIDEVRASIAEKGLFQTLVDLRGFVGDNQDLLGKLFPNQRALLAFLSLTGKNVKLNQRLFEDIADARGATQKGFDAQKETLQFKFAQLSASIKSQLITIYKIIAPVLKVITDSLRSAFDFFGNLDSGTQTLIVQFLALAAALGPVARVLGFILKTLAPKLLTYFSPTGLLIAGLVAFGIFLYENVEGVKERLDSLWKWIKTFFKNFADGIKQLFSGDLGGAATSFAKSLGGDGLSAGFKAQGLRIFEILKSIRDGAIKLWDSIVGFGKKAFEVLKVFGKIVWDSLQPVFRALKDVFVNDIVPALKNLWDSFKNIWDVLKLLWPVVKLVAIVVGGLLVGAFILLVKYVLPLVIRFAGMLIRWLSVIIKYITGFVKIVALVIGAIVFVIWNVLKVAWAVIKAIFKVIVGIITGAFNLIKAAWENILKPVFTLMVDIWMWMWSVVKPIIDVIVAIVVTSFDVIFAVVKAVAGFIFDILKLLWKAISFVAGMIALVIYVVIAPIIQWIVDRWNDAVKWFRDIWNRNGVPFIEGVKTAWQALLDWFGGIWAGLKSGFSGLWDGLKNLFFSFINVFIDGLNYWIGKIMWLVNKIREALGKDPILVSVIPRLGTTTSNNTPSERATGTPNWMRGGKELKSQLSLVGELGPELIWLPKGSTVVPNSAIRSMTSGGFRGTLPASVSGYSNMSNTAKLQISDWRRGIGSLEWELDRRSLVSGD